MGPVPVRAMRVGEEDAVRALLREANEEIVRSFPRAVAAAYLADMADLEARQPFSEVLVAGDPDLHGCVTFLPDASKDEHPWPPNGSVIRLLAVAPRERRRGVGGRLVDECLARAESVGSTYVGLHTAPAMVAARRLYERRGFVRAPAHDFDPEVHYGKADAPDGQEPWGLAYTRAVP